MAKKHNKQTVSYQYSSADLRKITDKYIEFNKMYKAKRSKLTPSEQMRRWLGCSPGYALTLARREGWLAPANGRSPVFARGERYVQWIAAGNRVPKDKTLSKAKNPAIPAMKRSWAARHAQPAAGVKSEAVKEVAKDIMVMNLAESGKVCTLVMPGGVTQTLREGLLVFT